MSGVASIDGRIGPLADAVVSVRDRGFLYADGVFETLRVYGGRPFASEAHLDRLARSAAMLGIALPIAKDALARELDAAIEAAGEAEAYARIMITRGVGAELSLLPRGETRASRVILVDAVRPPPATTYLRGLTAVTLAWNRSDAIGSSAGAAKLLSYVASIRALQEAQARGADDAIFVGNDDQVREASTSNLFIVAADGRLVTPPEAPDVLAGITRAQVLSLAPALGTTSAVEPISRRALANAREVFLTSSIREVASVVRVDGAVVGTGRPGEVARALHLALRVRAGATGPAPWDAAATA